MPGEDHGLTIVSRLTPPSNNYFALQHPGSPPRLRCPLTFRARHTQLPQHHVALALAFIQRTDVRSIYELSNSVGKFTAS